MSDAVRAQQMADNIKTLGLRGNGILQPVGLRSFRVLLDSGIRIDAARATILDLNPTGAQNWPPVADISVEGVITHLRDGTQQPVTKQITVDVADLAPMGQITTTRHIFGYEPQMPRIPPPDYEELATLAMQSAIQATMAQFALYNAKMVKKQVEVVYRPYSCPPKEGQGRFECRAKVHVPCGMLRLYPYGGTVLHEEDAIQRRKIEQEWWDFHNNDVWSCYMRGVWASAKMSEENLMYSARIVKEFQMYSALPPSFTLGRSVKEVKLGHVPPFWAVMRNGGGAINMTSHMEEYRLGTPEASHLGAVKVGTSFRMPFLSNMCDLRPGDVLVLPHDTGMPEKICRSYLD